MLLASAKTNWFHLAVIVILTVISIQVIKEAFAEPLFEWQRFNEVRAAEIEDLTK